MTLPGPKELPARTALPGEPLPPLPESSSPPGARELPEAGAEPAGVSCCVCDAEGATKRTEDGRGICGRCAKQRPELMGKRRRG